MKLKYTAYAFVIYNLEQSNFLMSILYFWGKPITKQLFQIDSNNHQSAHLQMSIQNIYCGDRHCILTTEDSVYGLGDNSEGQLGNQQTESGLSLVKMSLHSEFRIASVACGWQHTLLLDQFGQVYSSGKGDHGQLGVRNITSSFRFSFVLKGATQISAGKDHSLALCGSKVMGWGNSRQGQLGFLIRKNYTTPKQLNVYPCSLVFAGPKYSLFVTSRGVYGTGINDNCQLGLGHETDVHVPRKLTIDEEIVKITGGNYCAAATRKGQWYLWGTGGFGVFKYPTKMSFLKDAQAVSIGVNFGVVSRSGQVWVWGCNRWGELGLMRQAKDYACQAQQISNLHLSQLVCGGNFIVGYHNNDQKQQKQYLKSSSDFFYNRQTKGNQYCGDNPFENQEVQIQQKSQEAHQQNGLSQINYNKNKSNSANRRLYQQQHLDANQQNLSAFASNTWQYFPKKVVKLSSSLKRITSPKLAFLQKQNQILRDKLMREIEQKQRLRNQYMTLANKTQNNRLVYKINQLQQQNSKSKSNERKQQIGNLESLNQKLHTLKLLLESASR